MLYSTGFVLLSWEVSIEWDQQLPMSFDLWRDDSLHLRFLRLELIISRRPPVLRE